MALRLIVLASMLVWASTAIAAPITFEFTSTVVSVESAFLGVHPGDPVIGRYAFESTTASTSADPTVGRYEPITGTFAVQFGLLTLSIPLSYIEVLDRPELDRYTVAALSGTG